ncbi:MAG: slipin family protein [Methanoregula sp.]|jgi:regulator of protease activity HflC (stomatin/prohibitin superfamily)|uniref:slipin family protein n=1 Tax=Methanoregula sp. TaxID=2052170 RepID=UPI003C1787F2
MDSFTLVILAVILVVVVAILAMAIRIANQWERAVVLFLGKFVGIRGPGLFLIIPFLNRVPYLIDLRVITTSFTAEQTLTKDTVPVNVDAVLFWQVVDVEKAALEVKDYQGSISLASQTALRDVIGKTILSDMLTGREAIDTELQRLIGSRVSGWGISILSVEIRDVVIPGALQDAMSMQAQAERERQARVILGDSERQIAEKFEEAAKSYEHNPTALHLRAMNMLYEGLKGGQATIVIVPSTALQTMTLGDMTGTIAFAKTIGKEEKEQKVHEQQPQ